VAELAGTEIVACEDVPSNMSWTRIIQNTMVREKTLYGHNSAAPRPRAAACV